MLISALNIRGTFVVLCNFRRIHFVLLFNDFGYVQIMNFCLLGRKVCWNFWGLKILENLFIILFLSWSVDFFIVFYNDLTRPVRHTWMVCSFDWLIGICIIISEFYPVQRWVIITLILGKFNLFHLLLEILNLLLFLAIFEQRN